MRRLLIPMLVVSLILGSCEDVLDVKPDDLILPEEALQTETDFQELLNSCYDVMAETFHGKSQWLSDLLSDDLSTPNDATFILEIYTRNQNFFNSEVGSYFKQPYITIYRVNSLLFEMPQNNSLSASFTQRVEAEGKFLRALCYYDLVRKFAQPYGYTSDNSHLGVVVRDEPSVDPLPRSTVAEVYDLILSDLAFARDNLPEDNGIYANRDAAIGLLARVHFTMNDFATAADYAGQIISSGRYQLDEDNRYSQDISPEMVWGIISSEIDNNSGEFPGKYSTFGNPTLGPAEDLYLDVTGDTNDLRASWFEVLNEGQANEFIGFNRFNENWFNVPLIHLTNMLLIRAESLAELGTDLPTAREDLNQIINRAYGANAADYLMDESSSATAIINTARREKRIEMFGEGERLFDLKRRGILGENITIRGSVWDCPGSVMQFPISERTNNFVMNETGGC